ncbi:stage V sporulation protein AA [Gorillibacterium timonense]|uniref:stage V sporulation protein AA n=1 Tax=Gorillibacterium timonense TaxID=1689269 RepID=UPI000B1CF4E2|nr:stage V sporulation protein AA [Gorillibacterium timonense]
MTVDRYEHQVLYLRFRKRVCLEKGEALTLGKAARLIADPDREPELKRMVLTRPEHRDGNMVLVDVLHIVELVRERYPDMRIEHFGEPFVLVEVKSRQERIPGWLLVTVVWLLLFIGSGLTIMNFHADVSMQAAHRRMYQLITGKSELRPYALQIPYSLGIGIGMALFFNRFFKKTFNEEPSPLEVEMFLYQENMNQYIVTEEYGKLAAKEGDRHGDCP